MPYESWLPKLERSVGHWNEVMIVLAFIERTTLTHSQKAGLLLFVRDRVEEARLETDQVIRGMKREQERADNDGSIELPF